MWKRLSWGIPVLAGCLVRLLSACKLEPESGEGAPAKVPEASGAKCYVRSCTISRTLADFLQSLENGLFEELSSTNAIYLFFSFHLDPVFRNQTEPIIRFVGFS